MLDVLTGQVSQIMTKLEKIENNLNLTHIFQQQAQKTVLQQAAKVEVLMGAIVEKLNSETMDGFILGAIQCFPISKISKLDVLEAKLAEPEYEQQIVRYN